jgi:hypothetical protein
MWCPTGLDTGSFIFFLLYINDLPKVINKNNNMVLFADDTKVKDVDRKIYQMFLLGFHP